MSRLSDFKQGSSAWCVYEFRCKKVLGKEVKGVAKIPVGGCVSCDVPLCKERQGGALLARYHSSVSSQ
jgi:hypothetical protein